MSRGTMTMKMISSTSTTSTSGVMLISDCRLEPETLLLSCMMLFSPRLCVGALRDQPHAAEAGILDRKHGLPDLAEVESRVPLDYNLRVRLGAHRCAEAFAEIFECNLLVVDPQPAGVVDGDQDSASLVALLGRLRRVRKVNVRSFPHLRRHDHEDDQQHQHHVNERRDVDGRLHLGWFTETHRPPPLSCSPTCPLAPSPLAS